MHSTAPSRPGLQRSRSSAPNFAFAGQQYRAGARRQRTSLPFSLFGDSFNLDDLYSSGYPVASEPPAFLLQAARAMGGSSDSMNQPQSNRDASSNQPLLIELQGGRYVRVNNAAIDGEALPLNLGSQSIGSQDLRSQNRNRGSKDFQTADSTGNQSNRAAIVATASPAHDLPPAVLIFHDGRSEEVRDYTIVDGALYARGDFYTDGYWNKKIDISSLDLAQTMQANDTRNVKFILPKSPNEVITRP